MIVVNARFLTQELTGTQRFAVEISKRLKDIFGKDILFVAPKDNLKLEDTADRLGTIKIGKRRGHFWEQIDLVKFLRKNNNPLLVNLINTAPIFYKNKISTIHDIAWKKFPNTYTKSFVLAYSIITPKMIKSSKHIITVSNFSKEEIKREFNVSDKKISVVYNAVSEVFTRSKGRKRKNIERYILAVSSINYRKNFHSLLKAFLRLNRKYSDIKLYVVGGYDKTFSKYLDLDKFAVNKNIKFLERVNDKELASLYRNALCFAYPSLYEGFGIPPLEAMACGTPVVTSNTSSLPEVCGDAALYVNPYSIESIQRGLEKIIENENLRKELIEKGKKQVKKYSWDKSTRKLANIISSYL